MSELILTDEERKSNTFLEWDDASLGRACKHVANMIADPHGKKSIPATAAGVFLIENALAVNADAGQLTLEGVTKGDVELGDWTIHIMTSEKAVPLAYIVPVKHGTEELIFNTFEEAEEAAIDDMLECDDVDSIDVYPLYAGKPVEVKYD